jgi:hypothetical protein
MWLVTIAPLLPNAYKDLKKFLLGAQQKTEVTEVRRVAWADSLAVMIFGP